MRLLLIVWIAFLSACASKYQIPKDDTQPIQKATQEMLLQIQYLGVGGHRLQFGNEVIVTAPSFTNPHFLRLGPFMPIKSDHERVDHLMPESLNAQIMLVGHAHYDHLMDVPHILKKHTPNAHLYGSTTTLNSISSVIPRERMTAVEDSMGTREQAGTWHYSASGKSRIMALKSSHAPHFMGIKLMQGQHKQALPKMPWHAFAWKEGQTLAYVIDFLDDQKNPLYRIFYQDSASAEQQGLVPALNDGKGFDVAIICPASFAQIEYYPESIVQNTQAKHFILGHWEDFFGNDPQGTQKFVRNTNSDTFIARLNAVLPAQSHWTIPSLFATYSFGSQGLVQP